jgi:hypothetical protein
MKKKPILESGIFHPRVLLALTFCLVGSALAMFSFAGPLAGAKLFSKAKQVSLPQDAPPVTPSGPGIPRYYSYAPGPGIGESSGEPSIGYNPMSKKVMYISNTQTLQATLPEEILPKGSVPQSCNADWADVSYTTTKVRSVDPILFTDQTTGRTFVSQLNTITQTSPVLLGLNSLMAFTDNDGATWTPAQINPPDGSNDHQTVGGGPYPAALSALANSLNKGHAIYYCGQLGTVNAGSSAFCSRSDDGGLNFGKSIPVYQDTVSGCTAAIHGHVKVAPDGTAYLPNGGCGGNQSVFVSTDAGTTWTLHKIPGSLPMAPAIAPATFDLSDPSVGIASDGTVYFAYTGLVPGGNSTDNHIFVSVSHNQGSSWSTPVDVGAALGIKNAVFAAAVAGDPQRAAVAFLGTTTSGNHQGADFTGTWYGFVAHTYNGGTDWTTVNASGGPVQRNSCIWNSGGNNTCRNLLDFNDATMDDKGRVLFAYADGCVGECETGGPNSYSSKATFSRQSGGKSLLSQFDTEFQEPVLPQRACLSACRDDRATYLKWNAPDNGGSPITLYKIYRSDAQHPEIQIGTQTDPNDTTFSDRSVDPAVATYSYRVRAVNGLGDGPFSNSVSVPVSVCLTTSGPCTLPGVTALVDPAGDETDQLAQHDITSVSVAEPMDAGDPTGKASNVVVTIKVANLTTIPPGWRWSIRFGVVKNGTLVTAPPSGIPGDTSPSDYFVSMVSDGGASAGTPGPNSFTWGVTSTPNNAARLFTTKGALDPASNANPDGTITLVVPKSIIQNPGPGDSIAITLASVRLGSPSGGTNETIPDSTGAGSYTVRATNLCLPNTAPLAVLTGNVDEGTAPLTVNFDASGSHDPDSIDTIASYTFNFGDGGDDVTQTSPLISHVFNGSGEYIVRLVVTDSRGKVSSNTASFIVEVEPVLGLTSIGSRKIHGDAGPFDIDLPITGTAGLECRVPGAQNTYQIVYSFNKGVTAPGSATKTQGTALVGTPTLGPGPNQVSVPLRSVTDAQHLTINLSGVQSSIGEVSNNQTARMDVLVGDVTGNGVVTNTDVGAVKASVDPANLVNQLNFRADVTGNGFITNTDVGTVKAQVNPLGGLH